MLGQFSAADHGDERLTQHLLMATVDGRAARPPVATTRAGVRYHDLGAGRIPKFLIVDAATFDQRRLREWFAQRVHATSWVSTRGTRLGGYAMATPDLSPDEPLTTRSVWKRLYLT
jgi:hypothetical protein